jgi:hypothetical protein
MADVALAVWHPVTVSLRDHAYLVAGVLLAVALSLLTSLLGVPADLSLVVGLIGVSISLQLDTISRFTALRAELQSSQSDLRTLGAISDGLARNPRHMASVQSAVRSLDAIDNAPATVDTPVARAILPRRAAEILRRADDDLAALARGSFSTSGYDFVPLNLALSLCVEQLRAVAIQGVDRLISGDVAAARKYFELQQQLTTQADPVPIERIIVYTIMDDRLLQIIARQRKLGVKLYTIDAAVTPEHLKIDCAIVDSAFVGQIEVGSGGGIIGTRYSTNPSDVALRVRGFEELKSLAAEDVTRGATH